MTPARLSQAKEGPVRRSHAQRDEGGFTALELVVAILLFAEVEPIVDKFGHARLGGAAAALVGGKDQIAKEAHGVPVAIVEDFALEGGWTGRLSLRGRRAGGDRGQGGHGPHDLE